jgi:EAL domain-containing protein (putative c-di-GMP-specific phosphodiesterase class I)
MTEISRLCHELKILVLAEGVETETQLRQVRTSLCDYVQGYYFAKPMPAGEFEAFLTR